MVTQAHPQPPAVSFEEAWPPHDTEESIVGISLHQTTVTNVRLGINGAARLYREPGQPLPWSAETQLIYLGCRRPDGSRYRTLPDVFVFPRPSDPRRSSFSLAKDGPPLLVIEVLSESTFEADLDLVRGKGYSYARAGVPEYLALDPTGDFLSEGIRAWRLEAGAYRPWEPDPQGRWQSAQIPVAFSLQGIWAAVHTRDGRPLHREGEVEEELARAQAELERLRRQLGQ